MAEGRVIKRIGKICAAVGVLLLLAGCASNEVPSPVQHEDNRSAQAVAAPVETDVEDDAGFDQFDDLILFPFIIEF